MRGESMVIASQSKDPMIWAFTARLGPDVGGLEARLSGLCGYGGSLLRLLKESLYGHRPGCWCSLHGRAALEGRAQELGAHGALHAAGRVVLTGERS